MHVASKTIAIMCSASLSALVLSSPAYAAQAAEADAGTDTGLEEIVVSAQRIDQKLQDVPISITAFSQGALDRLQINTVADLSRLTPNVQFDPVSGGSTGIKPYIRGGGVADGGIVTSESEVSFYVDDVYRARISAALVDFVELERIEVVRGPQGVLYGRNSSAGAVRMVTRGPTDTFEATGQVGFGSWNERRLKGFVSGPLNSDKTILGSLNGMIRGRDGGRQFNITTGKKVGNESFEGLQADLAYQGSGFKARLTGFYTDTDTDGQYAIPHSVVGANPKTATVTRTTASTRQVASPTPSYTHVEQYGATLRMSLDYGSGELTSITGYSHLNDAWQQDFSGGVSLGGPRLALFNRTSDATQHQFSQEIQAAGSLADDKFSYVAGLYYFTETADQTVRSTIFFNPSSIRFQIDTKSYAGFGQLTFHATDKLSLIAGGRYSEDRKRLNATLNNVVLPTVRNTNHRFTPKVGIDYKVNAETLLYVSYSEGFKSGGFNGLAATPVQVSTPFQPQYTKAYEAGVKSDLLDNSLRINLSAFLNKIKNRQNTLTLPTGAFVVENYNADLKGLELETVFRVAPGLTLRANGAVNDGKYVSGGFSAGVLGSIIGNDLPVFPKYNFGVGFDFEQPLGSGKGRLGMDLTGHGSYFSTADNAAIGFVESRRLLNGYIGYDIGQWSFQVAGKNLLDKNGTSSGFGFAVINPRFAIEPRTVLATARFKF